MNKFFVSIVMTMLVFILPAQASLSTGSSLNVISGLGAGYNYLYPKDSQIQNYYSKGITYKAFIELQSESGLSINADIGIYSEGNHSSTAPLGTSLTIIPATASLSYHMYKGSTLSPYFGFGLGLYNINESDPDFNYLSVSKFGKHIFAGIDVYFTRDTLLRAELRQTMIDPVNSSLYYQANFGGLTGMISLAVELPFFENRAMTTQESELAYQRSVYEAQNRALEYHLREMESYYNPVAWNNNMYQPWNTPDVYINVIGQNRQQIEDEQARAAQQKIEQEKKRNEYLNEKLKKRQEKKTSQ